MARIKNLTQPDDAIVFAGIAECPAHLLTELVPVGYSKSGVIVANDRETIVLMQDGLPVQYTVSAFIQRAARTPEEEAAIAATKHQRELSRQEKLDAEQSRRDREIAEATKRGRESLVEAISDVDRLSRVANTLRNLHTT